MQRWLVCLLCCVPSSLLAEAVLIAGQAYRLVDSARYCYLPFVPVYEAHLFRAEPGQKARACLRLDYQRNISAQTLSSATRTSFADRHGEVVARQFASLLDQVDAVYQDVTDGSSYLYCLQHTEGVLSFNADEVLRFNERDFAQRFMQIWLDNPFAEQPRWQFRDCG